MPLFGRPGLEGLKQEEERLPAPEEQAMLLGAAPEGLGQNVPGAGYGRGGAISTLHSPLSTLDMPIGKKELARATELLTKYKQGKTNLENRIVEDELWWELRHWEAIRGRKRGEHPQQAGQRGPEPTSAWLFNAITNKHADAMDNFPEPVVLPRERSDEQSAKILSSVLPVILEGNGFEQTYSDNWWEKLKHGTAAYGVFWDPRKENGLGDISIRPIDLLKLFWEPGITDLQQSRNLFLVELEDQEVLEERYPEHRGKLGGRTVDVKQYLYDDTVDTGGKSVVVDWYYKTRSASGRTLLHYAKFVGDTLLFASENDPAYAQTGWYEHGLYPVVLDPMFPEKGTPVGFGYVSVCKDPQIYIDKLSGNILENAMMGTKKRFFASSATAVNEQEFLDWNRPIVHVEGELDDRRLKEIEVRPLDSVYINVLQMKIEEMKDTASNRDVNSGGTGSGVTAASAIAALQEAGNKASRDMIAASYRAYTQIAALCVELIRQFYDEARAFRITGQVGPHPGDLGSYEFVDLNNAALKDQPMGVDAAGVPLFRRPVFDLKIRAQKKNPFSRMEQNERAKELYGLGFFNPERAQESLGALEMMDFEGKDKVVEYVKQGQTLLNTCQQMNRQLDEMAGLLQAGAGVDKSIGQSRNDPAGASPRPTDGGRDQSADSVNGAVMQGQTPGAVAGIGARVQIPRFGGPPPSVGAAPGGSAGDRATGSSLTAAVTRAQTPMMGYNQRLAERSTPKVEG